MERIFSDGASRAYFAHVIDLLDRSLDAEVIEQIVTNNIKVVKTESPGFVITNFNFPPLLQRPQSNHLVIIDEFILNHCGFTVKEKAAALLHEFGHILNYHPERPLNEFYADYFVKDNGFDVHLVSGFEKYINSDLPYISEEMRELFRERTEAVLDPAQEPLVGDIKARIDFTNWNPPR